MALPAGISTCTVTLGKALGSLFEDATLSGTLTLDRRLVWSATGDTLYAVASPVVASQSGGWLSFVVAHVDQNGFVDQSGNGIKNFSYTFNGRATFSDGSVEPIVKHFQTFVGETTKDLDLLPDGPATLPVVTPVAPVDNAAVAGFVANPGPTKDALSASIAAAVGGGDTGWRFMAVAEECALFIRRVGRLVEIVISGDLGGADGTEGYLPTGTVPSGFRPSSGGIGASIILTFNSATAEAIPAHFNSDGSVAGLPPNSVTLTHQFITDDAYPSVLPGDPQ